MNHAIAREFHFFSLLKFSLPTIIMMIFMSLYTIVDGIFISRFVGTDALSATNIVYPVVNIMIGLAVMLATGGSAIVARQMGEGRLVEAKQNFSFVVLTGVAVGIVISAVSIIFLEPICYALGSSEKLIGYCKDYLGIMMLFAPVSILQMLFNTFFVTAGKPALGLTLTVFAGLFNAVFDYVLIVPAQMGIKGAAYATAIGYCIPAVFGLAYFFFSKNPLRFCLPKFRGKILVQSCLNGSSEMVTNLSSGIITFLFNIIMMRYLGENGVAAITIVLYGQFLLTALFLGFSMGVAPVFSYNYGSQNHAQMKRLFKICMWFVSVCSLLVFACSILFASPLVSVFSPAGTPVYDIAVNGFVLFSFSYLFAGVNMFSSALFTALSNGFVSAAISFLRTFVFIVLGIFILPLVLEVNGVWLAVPFAELLTLAVSCYFLKKKSSVYHYR